MTSSLVIPCLYNSFSFTPENINDSILYYDVSSFKHVLIPVYANTTNTKMTLPVQSEPAPAPAPALAHVSESSDSESESSDSESTVASSSVSMASSEASHDCKPNDEFNPSIMSSFTVSPSGAASDSLLWIAYIMLNGHEKFETIDNHYTESNTFKYSLVELTRKHKPILKANKIKLNGIEECIVHKPFINLETLQAIVLCKNMSVCIVQDRKYYEIQNGTGGGGGEGFIIEKIKGKYVLYECPDKIKTEYLKYIRANYWLMESISTPIRPMSAYKLQDLIDISVKLGLPVANIIPGKFGSMGTEKRKTKPELYEAICKCI